MAIRGDRAVERVPVWDAGRELAHGRTYLALATHERGCSGPDIPPGARIDDPEMRIEHPRNGGWCRHRRRPRSDRRAGEGAVAAGEVHREALGHRGTLRQTDLLDQQLVRERAIKQWAPSANGQNHCLTGRDIDELVLANWPLGGLDQFVAQHLEAGLATSDGEARAYIHDRRAGRAAWYREANDPAQLIGPRIGRLDRL